MEDHSGHSPSDHDWLKFSHGQRTQEHIQPTIQDFIMAKDEFLIASQELIMDTMIQHSTDFLLNNITHEEMTAQNSNPTTLEENIQWDEGTDDTMILNLIIKDTKIIYNRVARRGKNKKLKGDQEAHSKYESAIQQSTR